MSSNIAILLLGVPFSTGIVYLFCVIGSYTTNNFAGFADASYESLWHKFPVDLQKYLQMIIADGQRPMVFQGLGIVDLNLMAFTQVAMRVLNEKRVIAWYCQFPFFFRWWRQLPATTSCSEIENKNQFINFKIPYSLWNRKFFLSFLSVFFFQTRTQKSESIYLKLSPRHQYNIHHYVRYSV